MAGAQIAPKAIAPKFSRMNPIKGIQRMFSARTYGVGQGVSQVRCRGCGGRVVFDGCDACLNDVSKQAVDAAILHAAFLTIAALFLMSFPCP